MNELQGRKFSGERALFKSDGLYIRDCEFLDGESPLKESRNVILANSVFRWKYPLWYGENFTMNDCLFDDGARAGIWYTVNITVRNSVLHSPKTFRRSKGITLENVTLSNAAETMWSCKDVVMTDVVVKNGDYFAMNCENLNAEKLDLCGNYAFDGGKNVIIKNSRIISKDAFWNSENVTVYDSYVSGEYIGWNAKNLTLIGCTVESLQGFCYIENLVLKDCVLAGTNLAFEYSMVNAELKGSVDSIKNPSGGVIKADGAGEIIMEKDKVDVGKTQIFIAGRKIGFN